MAVHQMHGSYWAECYRHRPEWQGPLRDSYQDARDDEINHEKEHG
jgi:hypothetical protein